MRPRRIVSNASGRLAFPASTGTFGSYRQADVTLHRDTAMQQLSASHTHHLEEAQRIAHVGSWERDLTSGNLWWSDESCRIMGIEPGTFAGTLDAFLSFIHPDDRCLASPTDAQLATETTLESEYRIVRPDGTVRILHETAEVIRDPDGTAIRLMGTCLDITERVGAEQDRALLASGWDKPIGSGAGPASRSIVSTADAVVDNLKPDEPRPGGT